MNRDRKQKLIEQGPEVLAEALLELAVHSDAADQLIERLIATPKENVQNFKKRLSRLKQSDRFIDWRGSADFARELSMLLEDLKSGVEDPMTGLELVATFYKADEWIMNQCDDSSGNIGDVFSYDAKNLFAEYASRCTDKEKVAGIMLDLNRENPYGVRDSLIDCAGEVLPEDIIRTMIEELQKRAADESADHGKRHHLILIESLARQIKDAKLFEQTRLSSWGKTSTAAMIDIARVYLESGDIETAHAWLEKIPKDDQFQSYERDKLLQEIYTQRGDTKKLSELLHQKFHSCRSLDTLQALLDVIGHDQKDKIVADELALIRNEVRFNKSNVDFLIAVGKTDEAEDHLLQRADQLNGNAYDGLLSLVGPLEEDGRHLAASLIYRSLLISILERAYTKAYPHGVRYLKKLDKLSSSISDWRGFASHQAYKDEIARVHGRKSSFWSKYKGTK